MTRPHVSLNMAMTVDGKITTAAREYPRFPSPRDRCHMDELRALADAVIVGAESIRRDDPWLHVRDPQVRSVRAKQGKPADLVHVIVSARLDVPADARCFEHAQRCIVATLDAAPTAHALGAKAELWRLGASTVDVARLCERLHQEGVERCLVEGGATLNAAFLAADLIDRLHVTLCPLLVGGASAPSLIGGAGLPLASARWLELVGVERVGDELFCTYDRQR